MNHKALLLHAPCFMLHEECSMFHAPCSMKKGFTLLEVMLAISVMTLAVSGSFILIQQTLVAGSLVQSRLIAGSLTQEGFEIVRNIRDSNWLKQRTDPALPWDKGIADLLSPGNSQDFIADYQNSELGLFEEKFLNLDTAGFYSYSPGQLTIFKRKISITKINNASLGYPFNVLVEVSWSERGRTHQISAREYLYNWK